jgi:hypothetical protein
MSKRIYTGKADEAVITAARTKATKFLLKCIVEKVEVKDAGCVEMS